jgi:hypothetical protein
MGQSFHAAADAAKSDASTGQRPPLRYSKWILAGGAIWLLIIIAGMALVLIHSNSPGTTGMVPVRWPVASKISFDGRQPLLVMFAHPQCPCTRASLGELEQLMSDCQGRLAAQVWIIKPAGVAAGWTNSDLWQSASKIPGVTVHWDEGDVEAQRFHAETSGQTMLYGRDGRLLFQGGLTIARGHYGDSPGLLAMESLLEHKNSSAVNDSATLTAPVYGCPLCDAQCRQDIGGLVWK